jgi:hypothetical protein
MYGDRVAETEVASSHVRRRVRQKRVAQQTTGSKKDGEGFKSDARRVGRFKGQRVRLAEMAPKRFGQGRGIVYCGPRHASPLEARFLGCTSDSFFGLGARGGS